MLIASYILNPVVFSVTQKSPAKTIFLEIEMVLYSLTVLCIFLISFLPFTFLMSYPFQARHPSIDNVS